SLTGLPVAVTVGPDDDVRVAVAVNVTRGGNRLAEVGARDVALRSPRRRGAEAGGRPKVNDRLALICLPVGVTGRTDDDVRIAVAVPIARRGHRIPEQSIGEVALRGPRRGG